MWARSCGVCGSESPGHGGLRLGGEVPAGTSSRCWTLLLFLSSTRHPPRSPRPTKSCRSLPKGAAFSSRVTPQPVTSFLLASGSSRRPRRWWRPKHPHQTRSPPPARGPLPRAPTGPAPAAGVPGAEGAREQESGAGVRRGAGDGDPLGGQRGPGQESGDRRQAASPRPSLVPRAQGRCGRAGGCR